MTARLTIAELMHLTTIVTCGDCGLSHAPVRSCAETRYAHAIEEALHDQL